MGIHVKMVIVRFKCDNADVFCFIIVIYDLFYLELWILEC